MPGYGSGKVTTYGNKKIHVRFLQWKDYLNLVQICGSLAINNHTELD
jgi:hypothetical protein